MSAHRLSRRGSPAAAISQRSPLQTPFQVLVEIVQVCRSSRFEIQPQLVEQRQINAAEKGAPPERQRRNRAAQLRRNASLNTLVLRPSDPLEAQPAGTSIQLEKSLANRLT
jgi:hypothetical protein